MTTEINELFLNEVKKKIKNDNLICLFKTYLQKTEISNSIFEHILLSYNSNNENNLRSCESLNNKNLISCKTLNKEDDSLSCKSISCKFFDIINSCHKLFASSQKLLNDLSVKDITPYKDRDIEIIMSLTFYSSIYTILESNLSESEYEKISEIYEDANLSMNVPRNDEEENGEFFEILRSYYCNLVIPFKILGMEFPLNEYEFASLVYKDKIPKFVSNKVDIINVKNKIENELMKEAIEMCLNEF